MAKTSTLKPITFFDEAVRVLDLKTEVKEWAENNQGKPMPEDITAKLNEALAIERTFG